MHQLSIELTDWLKLHDMFKVMTVTPSNINFRQFESVPCIGYATFFIMLLLV